ncbi:HIRAN domain-containing protein [Thiomicrorhabdus indica]|uniref:HIRAN domain-containing protein n=1 Tax=Thiomicrorhabdus indica TaxID=2267253 RepID=UPI002AA6F1DD|nr:HIRAN domain-containing protein [Thiomicrorhabdus indica]
MSIYPVIITDEKSGYNYRIYSWRENLKVELDTHYFPKEVNYPQTFFNAKGNFLDALKTVLPMIFLDWANAIPLEYRQAVGVLAGNQTRMPQLLILRLMKQDAPFCEWVLQLANSQDGAYLRLMVELAHLQDSPLPVLEHWLLSLPGQPRHKLLSRMLQIELTAAQAKKTRKIQLDSLPWDEHYIREFFWGLEDSDFKAVLNTAESIRIGALPYLRSLPRWLWIGRLWEVLSLFHDRAIKHVLPPAILEANSEQQVLVIKAFKSVKTPVELEHKLIQLVDKFAEMVPFPRAPYAGNTKLLAIDSAKKLKSEGKSMQHCVGGYTSAVARGETYFYHWAGDNVLPTPLTVQLKPYPKSTQWQLVEALGLQNLEVDDVAWLYLKKQFANLNLPWGYLLLKTTIAGLEYSDYSRVFDTLEREMSLKVYHESRNQYDERALRIDTPDGHKLGYIPKTQQDAVWDYVHKGEAIQCRLNFLKPNYATVNVYLAPQADNKLTEV